MTLGRLVAGVPEIAGRTNRSYLQLAFLVAFIAHQILLWWRLWQLNTVEQWNFLAYFLIISAPLANYLTAIALVGTEEISKNSEEGFSHRWFFSSLAVTWIISAFNTWYFLEYEPYFLLGAILVVVAGAVWNKRWIHVLVLVLMLFTFFVTAAAEFTL